LFQAQTQREPCAVEQYKQVAALDHQVVTNLFAAPFLQFAQQEDLRNPVRQLSDAAIQRLPEFGVLDAFPRRLPVRWRRGPRPMGAAQESRMELRRLKLLERVQVGERDLTRLSAKMINNFVSQNAHQPGFLGGTTGKSIARNPGRQECFLNQVLGDLALTHAREGMTE
jgi:hypothetical protein